MVAGVMTFVAHCTMGPTNPPPEIRASCRVSGVHKVIQGFFRGDSNSTLFPGFQEFEGYQTLCLTMSIDPGDGLTADFRVTGKILRQEG